MFAAHINKHNTDILQKWTQRKLLDFISRLFDPQGITAPVTIVMKIKLQDIWRNRQHWDEKLPEDLQQFVNDRATYMAHLHETKVPRYYNLPTAQPLELHVFCDASTQAPATVIFIRFAHQTVYFTKFVMRKTRVAPLKSQTIPKLELQAAVYSCRLQRAFNKNTTLSVSKITHYTDSTVGYTTLTTDRKHILPTDYTKYDTLQLKMIGNTYLQNTIQPREEPEESRQQNSSTHNE